MPIHREQEPALGTKRQCKTGKVFVRFRGDFDDEAEDGSVNSFDEAARRQTPIVEMPAPLFHHPHASALVYAPAAAQDDDIWAIVAAGATVVQCSFLDNVEAEMEIERREVDIFANGAASRDQAAVRGWQVALRWHVQIEGSCSRARETIRRHRTARQEDLAARRIQKSLRRELRFRRRSAERKLMPWPWRKLRSRQQHGRKNQPPPRTRDGAKKNAQTDARAATTAAKREEANDADMHGLRPRPRRSGRAGRRCSRM